MGDLRPLGELLPGCGRNLPADGPVLRVEDVALSFGALRVLDGVSFEVHPGELLAIIGPNGAGKSSLFNCISGLYAPERGAIDFLGRSLLDRRPSAIAAEGVARTFQTLALFDRMSVLDNLMLGRQVHVRYGAVAAIVWIGRARREELRHRLVVEHIIEFLEIERYRKDLVGALPYGIRKRVELGRALAMEPKLLLLDEPVSGMNLEETEDMARFVADVRAELDVSILLVEHDMGFVMDLADRVLVLDFGEVVALGAPVDVQRDPDVIRAYLGHEHASALS